MFSATRSSPEQNAALCELGPVRVVGAELDHGSLAFELRRRIGRTRNPSVAFSPSRASRPGSGSRRRRSRAAGGRRGTGRRTCGRRRRTQAASAPRPARASSRRLAAVRPECETPAAIAADDVTGLESGGAAVRAGQRHQRADALSRLRGAGEVMPSLRKLSKPITRPARSYATTRSGKSLRAIWAEKKLSRSGTSTTARRRGRASPRRRRRWPVPRGG